jgi:lysyl-tRNA synthetase class II
VEEEGEREEEEKEEVHNDHDDMAVLKLMPPVSESFRMSQNYGGMKNQEMRYRQRYLDLILNPDTRGVIIIIYSHITSSMPPLITPLPVSPLLRLRHHCL